MNGQRPDLQSMAPWELADLAAEAVRALNHATIATAPTRGGYWHPGDVDETLAGLMVLVQRLPQALSQMSRWLDGQGVDGRIRHDAYDGLDGREEAARQGLLAAGAAEDELGAARGMLTIAAADLARASAITSRLGGFPDPDKQDDGEPEARDHEQSAAAPRRARSQ